MYHDKETRRLKLGTELSALDQPHGGVRRTLWRSVNKPGSLN